MNNLPNNLLIGMVHLPRIIRGNNTMIEIIEYAKSELFKLQKLGFHAAMIENFNDTPFPKNQLSEEFILKISQICYEIRKNSDLLLGLNLLRNACAQAMLVATINRFDFIRCNVWEGAYVTDQGIIESAAYEVNQIKDHLDSDVRVLADVFVKHAKPLVKFNPIDAAENAIKRGRASQVIVSGQRTGDEPSITLIDKLNQNGIKPIIGSGLTIDNLDLFKNKISGAIIGTSIKENRIVTNPISTNEAGKFVAKWNNVMD